MSLNLLATVQYSLEQKEEKLKNLMTKVFKYPLLRLFNDGNKITTTGRGMKRYFNSLLYPGGGFSSVAESGSYPVAQAESEIQPNADIKLHAMTVGYSEHALKAMENDPSRLKVSVQQKIRESVSATQQRMLRLFTGRGDGVVARASAAGGGTTAVVTSSIPVRMIQGDLLYVQTANGRADPTTPDYLDGVRCINVKYNKNQFTLTANDTWADDDVFFQVNGAANADGTGTYMNGLEALLDNTDDNWQWDDDDSATYDHVDTYLGQTRSSYSVLNCQEVDASSDLPDLDLFSELVESCVAHGANPSKLILIMHPKVYRAFVETMLGTAPRREKIALAGGDYSLPVIEGSGQDRLPVITDFGIPEAKIICLHRPDMYKLTLPGGWNKRNGSFWDRVVDTSTGAGKTTYQAYYDIWVQTCLLPVNKSAVAYAVSLT